MCDENQGRAAYHVSVTGVVQGVGFRPFVYTLAQRLDLQGWVLNHSGGVDLEIEGPEARAQAFLAALRTEAPPLAYVEDVVARAIPPAGYAGFEIRHSQRQTEQHQLISPDVATCPDCLRELLDPADRRYRYPFTNCTNCGPRFTIIADIPYDRPNTTLRDFPLCDACRAEYENPADRRFHAQPNACHVCGPHVWLADASGVPLAGDAQHADNEAVLAQACDLLRAGKILALKGLGGFQLVCDATNAAAVRELRARKRRPHKPFAVMVASLDQARAYCELSPDEEALLASPQCPIVLLSQRAAPAAGDPVSDPISDEVAPNSHALGVMLPYTPLHHLLLHDVGRPLVMTSGNLSEEPIAKDNVEALERLGALADAFLFHNRDIYARYDDSVLQVVPAAARDRRAATGVPYPVRRARGYAPFPVRLPFDMPRVLAVGPLLKNTFCLTRDRHAFLSQHVGDMENLETLAHYEAALATYRRLFRWEPERVACDLHPDYLTTQLAHQLTRELGLPQPRAVQHHQAHLAACLAERGWPREGGPVIGVALDGTGYGPDGAVWGGEWFVGDYGGFRRAAHLQYLPLPGGDAATRHPWRIALAYLYALLGPEAVPGGRFLATEPAIGEDEANRLLQQVERRVNTPLTSSMGRLFDAVSALLGVCRHTTYEAQAAIELEQRALEAGARLEMSYPFDLDESAGMLVVRPAATFAALLGDLERGVPAAESALRFHASVAEMIVQVCARLRADTGVGTVALSGGVFQNRLLLHLTLPRLEAAGFDVLLHREVPPNDGGVALGQAVLAHTLPAG